MATYEAGSAKIKLVPDLTGFHTKVREKLNEGPNPKIRVDPDTDHIRDKVRAALTGLSEDVKIDAKIDLTQARAELQSLGAGEKVTLNVDLDFTQAKLQLAEFQALHRTLHMNVDMDITAALVKIAQLQAAAAAASSVSITVGGIGGAANPIGLATTALMALAAVSLIPLIGQLSQALGVVALLPAAAFAAAAALGTVVIGSAGVIKAFQAGSKAATQAGRDQEAAAKRQEKAQRQVADAVKAAARTQVDGEKRVAAAKKASQRAEEALTQARVDARRELDNYQLSLRGAYWDEQAAESAVTDARKRLREANQFGSGANADDRRNARIDYEQAVQRLLETQQRNKDLKAEAADAARVGVEGSKKVRDAKDAQAEAEQGVTEAVEDAARANEDAQERIVDAQESLAEAMEAGSEAADAYRDALNDLSPAARDFVQKVRGLGDEWRDLRMLVQENLFKGFGDEVVNLSENLLPAFKTGLGGIATEINVGLRGALADLGSDSSKLDWTKILENTKNSIQPLMNGLSDLLGALQDIAAVGSEFLPELSGSFEDTMKKFHEWTSSDEGQNKIRTFLQESATAFGQLKDMFIEIGRVIGGLFSTSDAAGESMVESLTRNLREFADEMNTPEGKERMGRFWENVRSAVSDILTLVREAIRLAEIIMPIISGGAGFIPRSRPEPGTPEGDAYDQAQRAKSNVTYWEQVEEENRGESGFFETGWEQFKYMMRGFQNPDGSRAVPGGALSRWTNRLFDAGDADGRRESGLDAVRLEELRKKSEAGEELSTEETKFLTYHMQGGGPGRSIIRLGTSDGNIPIDDKQFDTTKMDKWRESWGALTGDVDQDWRTKLDPAFGGILGRQGEIGTSSDENIGGTASDSWSGLGSLIDGSWTDDILPVFTKIGEKLPGVSGFFGAAVEAIKGDWSKLKGYLAAPIDWVIREVFNNGIGAAWTKVDNFLGNRLPDWVPIKELGEGGALNGVPGMATGGMVPLEPGAVRGKDSVLRNLMPGEVVMSVPAVNAAGADNLLAFNQAALQGKNPSTEGLFQWGMAEGGRVQRDDPAWEMLKRGHDFAKAQDGKPYEWAGPSGVGSSFDCSGFLLSIAAEVLGRNPWQRYGYTGSFNPASGGPLGIKPGLGAGLSFGVFDNPGGDGGGHMAGTLSGVEGLPDLNVESSGGEGVRYGRGARGATNPMFPWQFHLPIVDGAFVDPGPGGGSGPSQGDQKGFLARKAGELFDKLTDPLGDAIKAGMGKLLGGGGFAEIPGALYDNVRDAVRESITDKIQGLTDGIRDVYDKVKGLASNLNPLSWVSRDTGGVLKPGLTAVYNGTGVNEYVMNPENMQRLSEIVKALTDPAFRDRLFRGETLMADQFGDAPRLDPAVEAQIATASDRQIEVDKWADLQEASWSRVEKYAIDNWGGMVESLVGAGVGYGNTNIQAVDTESAYREQRRHEINRGRRYRM
ncbi:putative tapemeasure protein [uncultured Caudovirales phage]|uniref:Putative tapemeasure protein n=1 Tax=uncultured Caudovirales phage TaxID=2100421 RepID=A0A2H4J594_9CAUD|nr:putative tapemeasure protein [uncultured Caudovirales phage]